MTGALVLLLAAMSASGTGWSAAEAKVEWRRGHADTIIVENSVWRCDGDTCVGRVFDTPLLRHRSCRSIARQAGGVTRFRTNSGELGPAELARCNGRR